MNLMKICSPFFDDIVIPRQLLNNPTVRVPYVIDIATMKMRTGTPNLERYSEDLLCLFLETLVFSLNFKPLEKGNKLQQKIQFIFTFLANVCDVRIVIERSEIESNVINCS